MKNLVPPFLHMFHTLNYEQNRLELEIRWLNRYPDMTQNWKKSAKFREIKSIYHFPWNCIIAKISSNQRLQFEVDFTKILTYPHPNETHYFAPLFHKDLRLFLQWGWVFSHFSPKYCEPKMQMAFLRVLSLTSWNRCRIFRCNWRNFLKSSSFCFTGFLSIFKIKNVKNDVKTSMSNGRLCFTESFCVYYWDVTLVEFVLKYWRFSQLENVIRFLGHF